MPGKRIKVVNVESASYDEIKDAVVPSEPQAAEVNEPPSVAEVEPVEDKAAEEKHANASTETANDIPDGLTEDKTKRQAAMATCEWCCKSMTAKNLKYSHKAICPLRPRDEETPAALEPVVEDPPAVADIQPAEAPPKSKKKRSVTVTDEVSEQKTPSEEKPNSKPKEKPKPEATPPVRRSKAVAKAELYERLVANALS